MKKNEIKPILITVKDIKSGEIKQVDTAEYFGNMDKYEVLDY